MLLFAAREQAWANIRVAIAAVAIFVPVMLITTLLHLDRFHFNATEATALAGAWAWIIVYVVVPFLLVAVLVLQSRVPGGDPPGTMPIAAPLRVLIGVNGAVALVVGLVLFLAPQALFDFWPCGAGRRGG